jgi:antitoxin PrlF
MGEDSRVHVGCLGEERRSVGEELVMVASEVRLTRAMLRAKGQLTLPLEIRAALHVGEGDEVEFTVTEAGEVLLRGMTSVPADQRWFWDPDWQAGEREASEQIKAGDVEVFEDVDAMFAALNE